MRPLNFMLIAAITLSLVIGFNIGIIAKDRIPIIKKTNHTNVSSRGDIKITTPLTIGEFKHICNLEKTYKIPKELILAVIKVESNFNYMSISNSGDYGLMQINKVNHKYFRDNYGYSDMLNPIVNTTCGTIMLSKLVHEYGLEKGLMAYNLGEGGAKRKWNQGIYSTDYVKKVLTEYETYRRTTILSRKES